MTNPREHHEDELDLDPETVKDLEPTDEDADAARGGALGQVNTIWITCGCPVTKDCGIKGSP